MANTIAGCNLTAIAEETLPALESAFGPLKGIMTDFDSDVAQAGQIVSTRIPTRPTAVTLASGYTLTDTTLTAVNITLGTFYGFVWGFTDVERSYSAVALNDIFIQPSVNALGVKVFGDIWNLVTNANFTTTSESTITAANFDRSDLADIGASMTAAYYPKQGRTLWASPAYYAGLVKSLNGAEFPGQSADKAEGMAIRTAGFDCYEQSDADANSITLGAFAFHRSALCMAARRVDSTGAQAAGVEVADVNVPGLNIPIQWRRWYDPNTGTLRMSVGLLYGVAKGTDYGHKIVGDT
jgi:hypothetical protein